MHVQLLRQPADRRLRVRLAIQTHSTRPQLVGVLLRGGHGYFLPMISRSCLRSSAKPGGTHTDPYPIGPMSTRAGRYQRLPTTANIPPSKARATTVDGPAAARSAESGELSPTSGPGWLRAPERPCAKSASARAN